MAAIHCFIPHNLIGGCRRVQGRRNRSFPEHRRFDRRNARAHGGHFIPPCCPGLLTGKECLQFCREGRIGPHQGSGFQQHRTTIRRHAGIGLYQLHCATSGYHLLSRAIRSAFQHRACRVRPPASRTHTCQSAAPHTAQVAGWVGRPAPRARWISTASADAFALPAIGASRPLMKRARREGRRRGKERTGRLPRAFRQNGSHSNEKNTPGPGARGLKCPDMKCLIGYT